jgi:two-component system, chemotaxis family, response regulator Rcp1
MSYFAIPILIEFRLLRENDVTGLFNSMFRILLAEDNPGDVLLFQEALKSRDFPFELVVAGDGQQAIAMVRDVASGGPRPHLIVLDVNLPRRNGGEVLRQIRLEPGLAGIPVVMLTSSSSPLDRATADGLGANLYLQKVSDLDGLYRLGDVIEDILRRPRQREV